MHGSSLIKAAALASVTPPKSAALFALGQAIKQNVKTVYGISFNCFVVVTCFTMLELWSDLVMKNMQPDISTGFFFPLQRRLKTPVPELISGLLSCASTDTEASKPTYNLAPGISVQRGASTASVLVDRWAICIKMTANA